MISTEKLLKMKELSEKATQGKIVGPLETEDGESLYGYYLEESAGYTWLGDYSRKEDAVFAVATNPTTIKAMIEELIEARKVIEFYGQRTEPDIESVFAKSANEWGQDVVTWEPLTDMGKLARDHLSKFSEVE